jgi:hypothetical protein
MGWYEVELPGVGVAVDELDAVALADEPSGVSLPVGEPDASTWLGRKTGSPPSRVALTMTPTMRMPTPTSPTLRTNMARPRISAASE